MGISLPRRSPTPKKSPNSQAGMSLIEMMIVLVIAGLFIAYGSNKFASQSSKMKAAIRKFTVVAKKLRNRARVDNKTYRLVFDLPVDKKDRQGYWVESTDKEALLLIDEEREELEKIVEENYEETEENKDKPKPDPQGFALDTRVIKKAPSYLPDGLFFQSIELDGDPIESIEEGRVFIYFFPQGFVQRSAIHITNRDSLDWTIAIEGITGNVQILPKDIRLEELKER